MQYSNVIPGRFVSRPNRFLAQVKTADGVQTCHVKNTGRCAELLLPGANRLAPRVTIFSSSSGE